jgi:hypothetical protein
MLYSQQHLRKNPSKAFFANSPLSPPVGILIGETQPEMAGLSIFRIPYSARIGEGNLAPTFGSLAIPKNGVIAKDITVSELSPLWDMQQQQQQQQSLGGFR